MTQETPADEWQPIETALETTFMRHLKGRYPNSSVEREVIGCYETGGYTEGWVDERYNVFFPTHWKYIKDSI